MSPVLFYVIAPYDASYYETAKNARFDECIEEKAHAIMRYRNTIAPKEDRIRGIEEARRLVDLDDKSNCSSRSSGLSDVVNFEVFSLLLIFIVFPASGILSKAFWSSYKKFHMTNKTVPKFLVLMFVFLMIIILTLVGAIIIWGLCLPAAGIPIEVKTISRRVGLPLLVTTLVMVEALGRAFAYSGKRVHKEFFKNRNKE